MTEGADNIAAAKAAFSKFERNIPQSDAKFAPQEALDAKFALEEGLDEALDIIDGDYQDDQKRVARNLIGTYRGKLIEILIAWLNDPSTFGVEVYLHLVSLLGIFINADCDEDGALSQLRVDLLTKAFTTMSEDEKAELIRLIQENTDSE